LTWLETNKDPHFIPFFFPCCQKLFCSGARKIAVFGLIRVGCMPSNIQKNPNELDASSCAYKLNDYVQIFNDKLQELLRKLNDRYTDAVFTYINSYEIDSDDQTNTGTNPLPPLLSFSYGWRRLFCYASDAHVIFSCLQVLHKPVRAVAR